MLLEADLPSDPQALRDRLAATMAELAVLRATEEERQAQIADLRADRAAARAEIVRLNAVNDHAEAQLVRLHDIIAALRRHRFGTRSEKLDDEQLEMGFEDTETALGLVAASLDAAVATPREPRRRKTNRGRLPAHLERIERVAEMAFDTPAVALGDLMLGERCEEASGRPSFLVGTFRDVGPVEFDGGQPEVVQDERKPLGVDRHVHAAAPVRRVATFATFLDLAALIGSDRQIAWATTIRTERLAALIADPETRADDRCELCLGITDAKWWIDHRSLLHQDLLAKAHELVGMPLDGQRAEVA